MKAEFSREEKPLAKEDYEEPCCPFSEPGAVSPIPTRRILEKLDEHLGRNDYLSAEQLLRYWLSEADNKKDLRGKLTVLNEQIGLYRKMKVGEQAMYLAQLKGMSAREAQNSLKEWFIRFGIQSWWDKKVEELSKGMAQKIQFITTVVHKPSLMILDEPFSGFDPVNADLIRKEILRLKEEGATIILSTHDMGSVEELCDEIALVNHGKLVISGGVDDIRREYGNNNVELVYTDEEGRHTEVLPQETDGTSTLAAFLEKGVQINSYRELMPRMSDIFIKLVTEGEEKK